MANTNCNKIINVKYVKDFIGSDLKNDTGGTITVNSSYSNTAYCPTYKELTNGSLVQVFSSDDTKARNNKDGMVAAMNSSATYTQNQLIPQESLLKEYTRFNSFSISANKNSLPGSGGTVNLSYTNQYVKHSFQMNDSCSVVDFSTIVYDTQDSGVTWSTNVGSISNKVLTVGANTSTSSRSIKVSGATTFRGTSHTDTFTITQSAGTDCTKYEVTPYGPGTGITDNSGCGGRQPNIYASTSALTLDSNATPSWMHLSGITEFEGAGKYMYFVEWNPSDIGSRSGTPIFKSLDGCIFSGQTIYQNASCDGGGGGGGGGDTGQTTTSVWFKGKSLGAYPQGNRDNAKPILVEFTDPSHGSIFLEQQDTNGVLINEWKAVNATNVDLSNFTLTYVDWNSTSCHCQNISYTKDYDGGKTIIIVSFDPSGCL